MIYKKGNLRQVEGEMLSYRINILGLIETRWVDYGEIVTKERGMLLYSGRSGNRIEHKFGVGILISEVTRKNLIDWRPIFDRLITACFKASIRNISIIKCYEPTEPSEEELKDDFYCTLKETLCSVLKRDIVIIMGDMNAKVGSDNEGREHIREFTVLDK